MGGRWKRNKGAQKKGNSEQRGSYPELVKENDKFKEYYKSQNILDDQEFEEFYKTLQTTLPTTFRITGTRSNAIQVREIIEKVFVPSMQNVSVDGEVFEPPYPLPWYPERLGWQLNVPRSVLRRSPEFSRFQKFVVSETEAGNISRQEAVSMVPVLLMDVKPHQWVLDMCAAPGSKTAQIIEAVHANDKLNEMPAGLVVANDADYKRSHMLVHQSKRLQSPCFMATNHDASHMPNIHVTNSQGRHVPWQFDRVLCDVPCSGDGTLRKNEKIWKEWSHTAALALHKVQVQIFLRGAQLLKVGGRMVYSTCSFNPVENEAVVAEVLRLTEGALRLVDVSNELPQLRRKPGLTTWKVMSRDGRFISSPDEVEETRQKRKLPESLFPPDNVKELNLERCLRIYPHQQNTGGFFVAVFEKTKAFSAADRANMAKAEEEPAASEAAEAQDEGLLRSVAQEQETEESSADKPEAAGVPAKRTAEEDAGSKKKAKKDVPHMKEAPFEVMSPTNPDVDALIDYYGLDETFPRDQYLLRSEEGAKNRIIYFCSRAVKSVLQARDVDRLHIVNTGVRLFVRQGSLIGGDNAPFRLTSEGMPLLEREIKDDRRKIQISDSELETLLTELMPKLEAFEEPTQEKLRQLDVGSCIFQITVNRALDTDLDTALSMSMPAWRGSASVNLLINNQDKRSLCQRMFGYDPELKPLAKDQ